MPTCCHSQGIYTALKAGSPCLDMVTLSLSVVQGFSLPCSCRLPVGCRPPHRHLADCSGLIGKLLACAEAKTCTTNTSTQMSSHLSL